MMMKTLFALFVLLCSIHVFGQQINLNDAATIKLPEGSLKLSKAQVITFADQQGYERRALPPNPQNLYKIDNMLLELYDFKDNDLDHDKAVFEHRYKVHNGSDSHNASSLKSFSNYRVLTTKSVAFGKVTLRFSSINNAKTLVLNGVIQCKAADEKNAEIIVDKIVSSVDFKE